MREHHDTIVIGGGQAGLAMSALLQEQGREHVVLERRRVGERWRTERWDSLRFQFPNWSLRLPGYSYAGDDPDGFAHYGEIVRLIEDYAERLRGPVREDTEVVGLEESGDPGFEVTLADGTSLHGRQVVVATGPFQRPLIPPPAHDVDPSVLQTDPTRYRSPAELPAGAVLVVGSGASGCQIAAELNEAGRRVYLSVSRHRRVPRRFRGKDVYWWLERMGRFDQTIDSFPSKQPPPSVVITGANGGTDVDVRRLAAQGVEVVGRVVGASRSRVAIGADANQVLDEADQAHRAFLSTARELAAKGVEDELDEEEAVDETHRAGTVDDVGYLGLAECGIRTIIWATGYEYDYDWIRVPVLDERGRPVQTRGVTRRPGFYFLGLHWMHTFGSGTLAGVGRDAEYLAAHMSSVRR